MTSLWPRNVGLVENYFQKLFTIVVVFFLFSLKNANVRAEANLTTVCTSQRLIEESLMWELAIKQAAKDYQLTTCPRLGTNWIGNYYGDECKCPQVATGVIARAITLVQTLRIRMVCIDLALVNFVAIESRWEHAAIGLVRCPAPGTVDSQTYQGDSAIRAYYDPWWDGTNVVPRVMISHMPVMSSVNWMHTNACNAQVAPITLGTQLTVRESMNFSPSNGSQPYTETRSGTFLAPIGDVLRFTQATAQCLTNLAALKSVCTSLQTNTTNGTCTYQTCNYSFVTGNGTLTPNPTAGPPYCIENNGICGSTLPYLPCCQGPTVMRCLMRNAQNGICCPQAGPCPGAIGYAPICSDVILACSASCLNFPGPLTFNECYNQCMQNQGCTP